MSKVKLVLTIVFGIGVTMCDADEVNSKSPPKASLKAFLSGDSENPVLGIRLRNIGDVPIMVDKELVFLPKIVLVDNERHAIPFKEIRAIEKPAASILKSRLATLKPGEEIERQVHLRKGFKQFVTGISTPTRLGGDEAPKVRAYEALCQMPADVQPFEIEVSYKPWYSFEEGFAAYMHGTSVAQFFVVLCTVGVPYRFTKDTAPGMANVSGNEGGSQHRRASAPRTSSRGSNIGTCHFGQCSS